MAKLINYGLFDILMRFSNTIVFGQDVAKKGGVYHVTADLLKNFGPRRIFDSPLDETSIIGFGIGTAHNGFIPIPEIQFLAYFHNAEDQIRGEASTLPFFSNGQFVNPMVLRIPGLGYQKGFGGHFHNDNSLTIFRDIPGLILAVPSNGADAVRMLRTAVKEAYKNGRIIIFIEPIALYMTKDLHKAKDGKWEFIYPGLNEESPVGEFKSYGDGRFLTILTYGNGLYLSLQAQKDIEKKLETKFEDNQISRLTIETMVSDDRQKTHSIRQIKLDDAELDHAIELLIKSKKPLNLSLHAAEDSFISIGNAATATLPSKDSIVQNALNLVNA